MLWLLGWRGVVSLLVAVVWFTAVKLLAALAVIRAMSTGQSLLQLPVPEEIKAMLVAVLVLFTLVVLALVFQPLNWIVRRSLLPLWDPFF